MTASMLAWKQPFIQRVRNSSLVERARVDDTRASRPQPKPETRTPKTQGFLINANRIRVSRVLRGTREGHPMAEWSRFHYLPFLARAGTEK